MAKELLKFQAEWCGPCKALTHIIDDEDLGVPVRVIDIDEDMDTPKMYGIRGVPTLVLIDGGKELKRITGVKTLAALKEWLGD